MYQSQILAGILLGSGLVYMAGIAIGLYAYSEYLLLGDPRESTDEALQKSFSRLAQAIFFRWLSVVFIAIAIVLDILFQTKNPLTLEQAWQWALALLIAEFVTIPILKRAKGFVWAAWVLRRAGEQGILPE